MKANELMVGDFVMISKTTCRCANICGHTNDVLLDNGVITNVGNICPIPLIPEILEKNGFVKELDSDGIHYRFTLIQGCSQFSLLYARSVFQWLYPIDFKYVHEFQHALKLCGIDKTIEL